MFGASAVWVHWAWFVLVLKYEELSFTTIGFQCVSWPFSLTFLGLLSNFEWTRQFANEIRHIAYINLIEHCSHYFIVNNASMAQHANKLKFCDWRICTLIPFWRSCAVRHCWLACLLFDQVSATSVSSERCSPVDFFAFNDAIIWLHCCCYAVTNDFTCKSVAYRLAMLKWRCFHKVAISLATWGC